MWTTRWSSLANGERACTLAAWPVHVDTYWAQEALARVSIALHTKCSIPFWGHNFSRRYYDHSMFQGPNIQVLGQTNQQCILSKIQVFHAA